MAGSIDEFSLERFGRHANKCGRLPQIGLSEIDIALLIAAIRAS
jgi:hypothetical protein